MNMVTLNVRRALGALACAAVCVVSAPAGMAMAEGSLPPDPSPSATVPADPSPTPTVPADPTPTPTPSPSVLSVVVSEDQFGPVMWGIGALCALSIVSVVGSWSR